MVDRRTRIQKKKEEWERRKGEQGWDKVVIVVRAGTGMIRERTIEGAEDGFERGGEQEKHKHENG